ncbi:gluconate 5-dehydrogenase [Cryobacterium flavum]|uniref:Gluconate 5-dehydrogenase n=1 Tax=Cryobacterium flavum TaxID=1424659 RepID=A0A4R8V799_9MICO|nr:SDR family NAD(P)-dependent oxidoreductase [Cryobacterium flavum]TFB77973.1 SDR family oxidoreductase [Cryobacterium flavum]SDO23941.1 gluconate 5-dehydrogenase [Cryobacterium flavum]
MTATGVSTRHAELDRLFSLDGRSAFITGAAGGLGFAIARALGLAGATVTITDIREKEVATAAEVLARAGIDVDYDVLDVTASGAVEKAVAASARSGLSIVVANAGISGGPGPRQPEGKLSRIDEALWSRVVATNLTGVRNTVAAAAHHVDDKGSGRVIVVSSVAGIRPEPMVGYAYAISKAAVVGLVRQAAIELAERRILVNAIAPGAFATGIGGGRLGDPAVAKAFSDRSFLGRVADASEIEGLALFLASDASSYVTGGVFTIDGGMK